MGSDYTLDTNFGLVIPGGQSSAVIHMHALPGTGSAKAKTVKLKLGANAAYKMPKRNGKSATVKIMGR